MGDLSGLLESVILFAEKENFINDSQADALFIQYVTNEDANA